MNVCSKIVMALKKFYHLLLLMIFSTGSVQALQLGQISVDSYLNEPLTASLSLKNIDASVIEDIRVNLADSKAYRQLELDRPQYLSKLKFEVVSGENLSHTIRITSKERIREPIMEVLIRVTDKQNIVMRLFTLMMDLRDQPLRNTVSAPVIPVAATPIALDDTAPLEPENVTETQPLPLSRKEVNTPVKTESTTRVKVNNDSLSIIAQNSPLHEQYSVYQIMRAFYLLNPQAFWKENINLLHSGSTLVVPDAKFVSEVSRQQAVNFVYSVSKDNPRSDAAAPSTEAIKAKVEMDESRSSGQVMETALNNSEKVKPSPDTGFNLSEDIKDDIKLWRTMVDQLKTISTALNSQNKAIQVQNSVIEEMNSRLESKANDIEQLTVRMDAIETMSQSSNSSNSTRDALTDWAPVTQTLDEQQSFEMGIPPGVSQVIASIKAAQSNNDQPLTSSQSGSIPPLVTTPEIIALPQAPSERPTIVTENIPVPQIIIDERNNSSGLSNFPTLWIAISGIFVLVLFFIFKWLKSPKTEPDKREVNLKNDDVPESVSNAQLKPKKKAKKGIVTNFDDTYDVMQVPVVSSKSKISYELDNEDNIHAEIDLLVAYQEFEEAQNLLNSAREKFAEDQWLDIMELKILAYAKDVDMFFFKMDQYKDRLSAEYPTQWKQIIKMGDKLNLELSKSKAASL